MMRKLMFTGKCENDDKWVYGDLIHRRIWGSDVTVIRTEDNGFDNYLEYCVEPETVGQDIGLTDQDRREIFEGYIVLDTESKARYYVKYFEQYACFGLANKAGMLQIDDIEDYIKDLLVIGNIHDNPELMEANDES